MLTIIFFAALIFVSVKFLLIGIKAAWGIAKFICTVLLLPALIILLLLVGLIYIALPLLIIAGIAAFIIGAATA